LNKVTGLEHNNDDHGDNNTVMHSSSQVGVATMTHNHDNNLHQTTTDNYNIMQSCTALEIQVCDSLHDIKGTVSHVSAMEINIQNEQSKNELQEQQLQKGSEAQHGDESNHQQSRSTAMVSLHHDIEQQALEQQSQLQKHTGDECLKHKDGCMEGKNKVVQDVPQQKQVPTNELCNQTSTRIIEPIQHQSKPKPNNKGMSKYMWLHGKYGMLYSLTIYCFY
jgi:hypothetical protein